MFATNTAGIQNDHWGAGDGGNGESNSTSSGSDLAPLGSAAFSEFRNNAGSLSFAVLGDPSQMQPVITPFKKMSPDRNTGAQLLPEGDEIFDDALQDDVQTEEFAENERGDAVQPYDVSQTSQTASYAAQMRQQQEQQFDQHGRQSAFFDHQSNGPQQTQTGGEGFTVPQSQVNRAQENVGFAEQNQYELDTADAGFVVNADDVDSSGIDVPQNQRIYEQETLGRTHQVPLAPGQAANTFDNSIFVTRQEQLKAGDKKVSFKQPSSNERNNEESENELSSDSSDNEIDARSLSLSDASVYKRHQRRKRKKRAKVERRRRDRMPHERTVAELEEERAEEWAAQIQADEQEKIMQQKRDLLFLFAEKESEGYRMQRQFNMQSDLREMLYHYYKIVRDERTDDEVEHLRSHLVEGTRMLLYLNENAFDNPLGLADMSEFADSLSSMLSNKWDRHLRNYVKRKHGLQGPPAQPLKNLALNCINLFMSHQRRKAAEEQKEKERRDREQREAMQAASAHRAANGGLGAALDPFSMVFSQNTNLMRGPEGSNYGNISTAAATTAAVGNSQQPTNTWSNDPDFALFEEFKRWKQQQQQQQQQFATQNNSNTSKSSAFQNAAGSLPRSFMPDRSTFATGRPNNLSVGATATLPTDMQPPQVESLEEMSNSSQSNITSVNRNSARTLSGSRKNVATARSVSTNRQQTTTQQSKRSHFRVPTSERSGQNSLANIAQRTANQSTKKSAQGSSSLVGQTSQTASRQSASSGAVQSSPSKSSSSTTTTTSSSSSSSDSSVQNDNSISLSSESTNLFADRSSSVSGLTKRNENSEQNLLPPPPPRTAKLAPVYSQNRQQRKANILELVRQSNGGKLPPPATPNNRENRHDNQPMRSRSERMNRLQQRLQLVSNAQEKNNQSALLRRPPPVSEQELTKQKKRKRIDAIIKAQEEKRQLAREQQQAEEQEAERLRIVELQQQARLEREARDAARLEEQKMLNDANAQWHNQNTDKRNDNDSSEQSNQTAEKSLTDSSHISLSSDEHDIKTDVTNSESNDLDDFDAMMAELEEECNEIEQEENVAEYNDVDTIPEQAVIMDAQKGNNKILDLLQMFLGWMNRESKGERPKLQSSMFQDLDALDLDYSGSTSSNYNASHRSTDDNKNRPGKSGSKRKRRKAKKQSHSGSNSNTRSSGRSSSLSNSRSSGNANSAHRQNRQDSSASSSHSVGGATSSTVSFDILREQQRMAQQQQQNGFY